jgi:hypothetical protein
VAVSDRALTDVDLDEVACELRHIVHSSQWDRILGIGKLIFTRFFNEDEAAWRERRRNKDRSIRRLAERPDCPFAKSALTEAVGIHVLCAKHPEARGTGRVTPTHVGKILGLEPGVAVRLLHVVDERGWSVRELAAEATRIRKSLGERRGRPLSTLDRKLAGLGKRVVKDLKQMSSELASGPTLESPAREALNVVCSSLRQELNAIEALLQPERRSLPARAAPKPYINVDLGRAAG